jgi:hypothetical protein
MTRTLLIIECIMGMAKKSIISAPVRALELHSNPEVSVSLNIPEQINPPHSYTNILIKQTTTDKDLNTSTDLRKTQHRLFSRMEAGPAPLK